MPDKLTSIVDDIHSDFDHALSVIHGLYAANPNRVCAVAVSGGPDSMCLAHLLSRYNAQKRTSPCHFVIVDHGLREDSAQEAQTVSNWLKTFNNHPVHILKNTKDIQGSRIQEAARDARYGLLSGYCNDQNISLLLTAHHLDDQAETLLFRLAKGSGLDGLSGIAIRQHLKNGIELIRPLLDVPKDALLTYCEDNNIPFVKDPSNRSDKFARVRLREAREVLEKEGLSNKRLAKTCMRLARAREALEHYSDKVLAEFNVFEAQDQYQLPRDTFLTLPADIRVRILSQIFQWLDPESDYGPRLSKTEDVEKDICHQSSFRKRSLGKAIIDIKDNVIFVDKNDNA